MPAPGCGTASSSPCFMTAAAGLVRPSGSVMRTSPPPSRRSPSWRGRTRTAPALSPAAGLSAGAVRVLPRHDGDLLLGGGDVLMTEPEGLTSPAAAVMKQGEEEAVPQPGAGIEDRLHLGDFQDPRQLLRRLQRDRPPAIRLPLADVMKERLPPAPPARPPRGQQVPGADAVAGLVR